MMEAMRRWAKKVRAAKIVDDVVTVVKWLGEGIAQVRSPTAAPIYRQVSALRNPAAEASSSEQNHRLTRFSRR
jgi:hypothetical protein